MRIALVGIFVLASMISPAEERPFIWGDLPWPEAGLPVGLLKPATQPVKAAESVSTDPATGLVIHRNANWLPPDGMLSLEASLVNETDSPVAIGEVILARWRLQSGYSRESARYSPLTHRNDNWYGSTYWTGPDWTRVGKDWQHTGQDTASVRRFKAPRDGRVTITGRVFKADTNNGGGDGVRLSIRHGQKTVWQGEIRGDDGQGLDPVLSLDVRKGDSIRFVVEKGGTITCDTTHWNPSIAYADGQVFRASEGFSPGVQGDGCWHYEMETLLENEDCFPRLYTLDKDLTLSERHLDTQQPLVVTGDDSLPLLVLSDSFQEGGITLALGQARGWRLAASLDDEGIVTLELVVSLVESGATLAQGATLDLPPVITRSHEGPYVNGLVSIQGMLASAPPALVSAAHALRSFSEGEPTDLALLAMVQADWLLQDRCTDGASYASATARHIEKTRALIARLRKGQPEGFLDIESARLDELAAASKECGSSLDEQRSLHFKVRRLKRAIALSNPLMDFGPMLFCKRVPTSYSHLVMQYFGWRARSGGGLYVLERPGFSLAARDILGGQLPEGSILEPRLSYNGSRVVFSFVECGDEAIDPATLVVNEQGPDDVYYHIYEVNTDGTGLRQLTSGPYDDVMPTYLPDGGIVFCSTRRRAYARCFGPQFSRRWHTYTLHRMDGDGRNITTLSFNDVSEWFPTVSNTGQVIYSRWDYIDRDAVTHQNLWATRPDGTNPVALWGNATLTPHCTFQMQPIPNSGKIVFAASAHHSIAGGSIAMVDPSVANNGQQAITRITPEIPFPEAEGREIHEYYAAPWPLSEEYFLVAYSPGPLIWEPGANERNALGLYLLDADGNRELLYRDPDIGCTNPCPLAPRPQPPVLASHLPHNAPETGEMLLMDIYQGLGDVPRGSIKSLRIIQIFPKSTPVANEPPIGIAREENGRAVLGTVPVEPDGSARFTVPARKAILFQALDENGFAYQTMRTLTYVQPGERVSCVGCHENRMTAPPTPYALRRPPSQIDAGPFCGEPFSYMRVVQPVLDKHCVSCHGGDAPKKGIDLTGTSHEGFTRSYWALCGDKDFWGEGTNPVNAAEALVPRFGARNLVEITPPGGMYGARGSRLIKMLMEGHQKTRLSPEEIQRVAMWIDCNAIFYGVNPPEDQARQLAGDVLPMPEIQ